MVGIFLRMNNNITELLKKIEWEKLENSKTIEKKLKEELRNLEKVVKTFILLIGKY